MDEQLEVAFEGAGMEGQSETPVSPGSEAGTAEEKVEEAVREEQVNGVATRGEASENARKATVSDALTAPSELRDWGPGKPSPGGEGGEASAETDEVPRNHYAEWQELAEAHPELVGKELPEDIYQECMRSELPPIRVYESMMLRKQAEQIAALQQEIATLRQNAENTARAPVSASAGSPENEPEDQFMQGFNSY